MSGTDATPGRARTAVRSAAGALGFLTRVPVGRSEAAWAAFTATPAAAVVPGYVVGALAAVVVAAPVAAAPDLPVASVAFAYVLAVYALVGVNNLDGVADCGDAMVVHGDRDRRREVLADTTTGVGALATVSLVVVGLALGAVAVAGTRPVVALAVVLAAEVGARVGLAALAALGSAPHDGLGSALTDDAGVGTAVLALALAVPAVAWPLLASPSTGASSGAVQVAAAGAFAGALAGTTVVGAWAGRRLGGPNGDVFGAATEVARVAGLHVGVLAWTLS
ncbi:adenosylcobinamide-GDP ribazoletransferase [Halorubellus salinus]|uniref:adenosylcobinamide-GDP ribazoletransferase n=1 Tax=Halorubellus salinus TaxID=755309 RepID=UPI001D06E773|nr:adenosylcobinamide-GDP ribazoletransferase [Halorubellus salinus]